MKEELLNLWDEFIKYKVERIQQMTGGEIPSGTSTDHKRYVELRVDLLDFINWLRKQRG